VGLYSQNKARILIIDDHPLFREGLKTILGRNTAFEVAGEAGNAGEGLEAVRKINPDLVTVDLSLPDHNGIELTAEIRGYLPDTPVMIISMHAKIDYITQAIQAGAKGYLLKESATDSLVKAIKTVLRGEYFIDSALSNEVAKRLMDYPELNEKIRDAAYGSLTPREQEIMKLLVEGLPKKAIAERLCVGYKTVDNHATKIFKKLSIHNKLELTRYAAKLGMIDVDLWKA
jgi:DNA-binding NarL/FixJ family response regulator